MKDNILRLRSEGKSYREIQSILGCSKGTISYHCGEGQKEKKTVRQNGHRSKVRKYIQEVKQAAGCLDCEENYPYYMLDFDHLGDKSFGISRSPTLKGFDEIKAEIAKCEVVCANCHRIRTYNRLLKTGGDTMDLSEFYT